MIPNNQANVLLKNVDKVCVVGLGNTGRSCLHYMNNKHARLVAMDSSNQIKDLAALKAKYSEVEFVVGKLDSDKLLDSDLIVLSPGVPRDKAAIKQAENQGVSIVGDIELFAHESDSAKVISITGSNGKSTVTALCGELLKTAGFNAQVGGNIGQPALDLLQTPADIYVLELSSFQLESTYSLQSAVAVILNISPDHMDRYSCVEDYIAAKQRIFNNAVNVVYNRADRHTYPKGSKAEKIISFGLDEPVNDEDFGFRTVCGQSWLCQGDNLLIAADTLQIKGQHNQLNALAALALAYLIGADLVKAISAFSSFTGLPHRFEFVGNFNGVDWINDSKGTNPGATLASISGQSKPVVLIAGGDAKGADFSILENAVKEHVKAIVLFGRDTGLIEKILPVEMPASKVSTLIEAIYQADEYSSKNDLVLFSPACASFDMFDNYVERGNAFKSAVQEYFS